MDHNRGTKTGFIGEYAALKAPGDCLHDHIAAHAAGRCLDGECAAEDGGKSGQDLLIVHADDDERTDDIENRHEGHDALVGLRNALNAPQDHQRCDDEQHHADDERIPGGIARDGAEGEHGFLDGGDLPHVADAEGSHQREDGEQHRQHTPDDLAVLLGAETVAQIIHRTAAPFALFIAAAEIDAQHVFREIGHHADNRRDPHPEHGAGAAHRDGVSDARDVARADSGGKRGAQRAELRDGVLVLALGDLLRVIARKELADGLPHPKPEARELEALGQNGHQNSRADEQCQRGYAPDNAVDRVVYRCDPVDERFHVFSSS